MKKGFILVLVFVCLLLQTRAVLASSTSGTIDVGHRYAWSKDFGWLNFAADQGNINVTDSGLRGYIWSSNIGWINLAPTNSGQHVTNDGNGHLSGYAWGEGVGWFGFSGITIDSNGLFHGISNGPDGRSFTFDCDQCSVKTDWRPVGVRGGSQQSSSSSGGGSIGNGGGGGSFVTPVQPTSTPVAFAIFPTPLVSVPTLPNTGSLQSGGSVVVKWSVLNIRRSPSLKGFILGQALVNTRGDVLVGAVKKDGYTWLEIKFDNGLSGWSVTTGLTLLNTNPVKVISSGFKIGDKVQTIGERNVRGGASIAPNILGTELRGKSGVILEGPIKKDGYTWWRIEFTDNLIGWVAQSGLIKKPNL